jgi:hypothetical protein
MERRDILVNAIAALLRELANGSSESGGWVLNPGDAGLLGSLDHVSAEDASKVPPHGTSSVAAHVEHLRYGLSLLNRAAAGENPFAEADWGAAWTTTQVSEAEWVRLRSGLAEEALTWQHQFEDLVNVGEMELTGVLAQQSGRFSAVAIDTARQDGEHGHQATSALPG